ncbi:MAG: hypothetical protein GC186_05130 [Rhodobacteraceae bacterium]|nr:hypothetical protein [Paracoccaceae bacterium]
MAEQSKASTSNTEAAPDLAAEIAALRKELEVLAGLVGRIGQAGVAGVTGAAKAKLGEGFETLEGLEARVQGELKARPLRALGLAALGGFVLGLILRR